MSETKQVNDKLLPCPFCGCQPEESDNNANGICRVSCYGCGAEINNWGEINSVKALWNTRSDTQIQSLTAQLEEWEAKTEKWKLAIAKENYEMDQILGKALSYPEAAEDIGGNGDGSVCTGEHVPTTLAMEAANKIAFLKQALDSAAEALKFYACDENWQSYECGIKVFTYIRYDDEGDIARAALAKIKE